MLIVIVQPALNELPLVAMGGFDLFPFWVNYHFALSSLVGKPLGKIVDGDGHFLNTFASFLVFEHM